MAASRDEFVEVEEDEAKRERAPPERIQRGPSEPLFFRPESEELAGEMAEITAALVKELRELTGLGMMECKKALDGSGRRPQEGRGAAAHQERRQGEQGRQPRRRRRRDRRLRSRPTASSGALVEVNCETDFVAKNEDFLAFARSLAELVATRDPADVAALAALADRRRGIEAKRQKLVQKIGENITIRRFERMQAKGKLAHYVHGGEDRRAGGLRGRRRGGQGPRHAHRVRQAAVPDARPRCAADVLERERKIQEARAKESGQAAEIAAKMVEGALNKFLGEITLLGQPFVKDDKQTVEKMLDGEEGEGARLPVPRGRRGHREEKRLTSPPK